MKFYIIPGYGEKEKDYKWLIKEASKKYDVVFLNWQIKNQSLREIKNRYLEPNSIIFGFSMGGMMAYKTNTPMKKAIYCSPSTVLEGDRNDHFNYMVKYYGKETAEELQREKYDKPKALEYHILFGDKEKDEYTSRFKDSVYVENTQHEFTDNYKKAVLDLI
jgi:esterase/lipase